MSARGKARKRALDVLYEAELREASPLDVLAETVQRGLVGPDGYAADLVRGVVEEREEIDALLARHVRGWTLDRMPPVDRNLLRIACHELLHRPDVPPAVAIDEAVRLAKDLSTEDSGRFVNGVLAQVLAAAGTRPAAAATAARPPAGPPR